MMLAPEFVLQLVAMVGACAAVYGGIRADLRQHARRLDRLEAHLGLGDSPDDRRRRFSDRDGF